MACANREHTEETARLRRLASVADLERFIMRKLKAVLYRKDIKAEFNIYKTLGNISFKVPFQQKTKASTLKPIKWQQAMQHLAAASLHYMPTYVFIQTHKCAHIGH